MSDRNDSPDERLGRLLTDLLRRARLRGKVSPGELQAFLEESLRFDRPLEFGEFVLRLYSETEDFLPFMDQPTGLPDAVAADVLSARNGLTGLMTSLEDRGLCTAGREKPTPELPKDDGPPQITLLAPTGPEPVYAYTFCWAQVAGAEIYEFELLDGAERVVWAAATTRTEIGYPLGVELPRAGKPFFWRVATKVEGECLTAMAKVEPFSLLDAVAEEELSVAQDLFARAQQLFRRGNYREAYAEAQQSLELTVWQRGRKQPETARILSLLGELAFQLDQTEATKSYLREALAICEQTLGARDPETMACHRNLGNNLTELFELDEARPHVARALELATELFGADHLETAAALHVMGLWQLYTLANFTTAEEQLEAALRLRRERLGELHEDTAESLFVLACVHNYLGRYEQSLPRSQRALEIFRTLLGPQHPKVYQVMNFVAYIFYLQGRYDRAEALYRESLAYHEEVIGKDHINTAWLLQRLGAIHLARKDFQQAIACCERALDIRRKSLGEKHLETARTLNTLGVCYTLLGDVAAARDYYGKTMAIHRELLPEDHPDVLNCLHNLASLELKSGDRDRAEALLRRVLEIRERNLGAHHPETTIVLFDLAVVLASKGDLGTCVPLIIRSLAGRKTELLSAFRSMSDREKAQWWRSNRAHWFQALQFLAMNCPAADAEREAIWEHAIFNKGLVFSFLAAQRELAAATDDPETTALNDRLTALKQRFLDGKTRQDAGAADEQEALRGEIEVLEAELARRSLGFALQGATFDAPLNAILETVPPGAVFIDYFSYHRADPDLDYFHQPKSESRSGPGWHYAGFGYDHRTKTVSFFEVGEAAIIDQAVAEIRQLVAQERRPMLAGHTADTRQAASSQRRFLFQKLLSPFLAGVGRVEKLILCLDGRLHLLPFELLETETGLLLEEYAIQYVSSGRDFLFRTLDAATSESPAAVFAAPDFGMSETEEAQLAEELARWEEELTREEVCRGVLDGDSFRPLPAASAEAQSVCRALRKMHPAEPLVYEGRDADKERFLQVRRPYMLHVATHGFFRNFAREDEEELLEERLLLSSGLALAGANRNLAKIGRETGDGFVTALEMSQMDLRGTELVSLSGCMTGVGQVENGEVVYGLRRALELAQAKSVLVTLWEVPDRLAAAFIEVFFANLAAGLGKERSLRQAKIYFDERERAKPDQAPFFWAAFVLIGKG